MNDVFHNIAHWPWNWMHYMIRRLLCWDWTSVGQARSSIMSMQLYQKSDIGKNYPIMLVTVLPFKDLSENSSTIVDFVAIELGFGTSRFSRRTRWTRMSIVPSLSICLTGGLVPAVSSKMIVLGLSYKVENAARHTYFQFTKSVVALHPLPSS